MTTFPALPQDFGAVEAYAHLRFKGDSNLFIRLNEDDAQRCRLLMVSAWNQDIKTIYDHIASGGRAAYMGGYKHHAIFRDEMQDKYGLPKTIYSQYEDPQQSFFFLSKPAQLLEADPVGLKVFVQAGDSWVIRSRYEPILAAIKRLNIEVVQELHN